MLEKIKECKYPSSQKVIGKAFFESEMKRIYFSIENAARAHKSRKKADVEVKRRIAIELYKSGMSYSSVATAMRMDHSSVMSLIKGHRKR